MSGLLVSVRNAEEALTALAGGADLIDVKEPLRGALGAADRHVWRDVCCAVAGEVPVSAALGELAEARVDAPADLKGLAYAKTGLAHCAGQRDWRGRWADLLGRLPVGVQPVAVVYADWRRAKSIPPDQVVREAALLNCAAVLVDTFDKQAGTLLSWFDLHELRDVMSQVRWHGMQVVLGGSLDVASIKRVLPLNPDYVAVRRAACRDGRAGMVDAGLVAELAETLSLAAAQRDA